jgi:hypothetical protein
VYDDGTGAALFAGGDFQTAGPVDVNHVAKWDGTGWSALGAGVEGDNAHVYSLTAFNDGTGPALYVGGTFEIAGGAPANRIAKWDGCHWSALGTGLPGEVRALTVFDDGGGPALYAGSFGVAKWDGSTWSPLGPEIQDSVRALAVYDDGTGPALYAGGYLRTAGGGDLIGIVKWDGSAWSTLNGGIDGPVYALAVFDDGSGPALYAAGDFSTAGGVAAAGIARWDGTTWSPLAAGVGGVVHALSAFTLGEEPGLYLAGEFTAVAGGDVTAYNIARWDGACFRALGAGTDGLNPAVYALASADDVGVPALYAGGHFSIVGNVAAHHVARWDGSAWSAVGDGDGLSHYARDFHAYDDGNGPALYTTGYFSGAGATAATNVARWTRSGWTTLGSGLEGTQYPAGRALATFDDGSGPALYVGGKFAFAGGVPADSIARWDGAYWSPVGSLTGDALPDVLTLSAFDDGTDPALYAGGWFTSADGADANHIAKWDGYGWTPLGTGVTGTCLPGVHCFAVFDDGSGPALYVGGSFTSADGIAANAIAKWDGSTFSPLDAGIGGAGDPPHVYALAVFDDGSGPALFAGGRFSTAGSERAYCIAKWDGHTWSAIDDGISNEGQHEDVDALAVFDDGQGPALYVAGSFERAGGTVVNNIARWDGNGWAPLSTGLNGFVAAMTVFNDGSGDALYVTGPITHAGGKPSYNIAKWRRVPGQTPGDLNCDGCVDNHDVRPFLLAIVNPALYQATYPDCDIRAGDCNGDGLVNNFDIAPFVRLISGE